MPGVLEPDDDIITAIFTAGVGEGAVPLNWQQGTRCTCYSTDTKQPQWGCTTCQGSGVNYAVATQITGLFRSQSRWLSFRREGELQHGEASLTVPLNAQPGYTDRRVRDRYTVLPAAGDVTEGRVFYPAAAPVPFIFNGLQRAWRVQLQSADQVDRLVP